MGNYFVQVVPSRTHTTLLENVPLVAEEHLLGCHDPDLPASVQSVQFKLGHSDGIWKQIFPLR